MKLLINKIKSVSDVITNSSSEVFVMCKSDAEYYDDLESAMGNVSIQEITWDELKDWYNGWSDRLEMICDVCGLNIYDIINTATCDMTEDDWYAFLELYHDVIEEKLIGLYWVEIEDHFEDAIDVDNQARRDSIWTGDRH